MEVEGLGGGSEWEGWSMGDWVAGTGVDTEGTGAVAGAGGEPKGEELMAEAEDGASGSRGGGDAGGATVAESWWVVGDSSTVWGGRAVELDVALQVFAATVGVGVQSLGRWPAGTKAGSPAWPEGLEAWAGQAGSMWPGTCGFCCLRVVGD